MINTIFYIILAGTALFWASAITVMLSGIKPNESKLWVLKTPFLMATGLCALLLIVGSLFLYETRKPIPKSEYEQITTPVYKRVDQ
jgi:uncharacterized membrane protein (UPF0136 family)